MSNAVFDRIAAEMEQFPDVERSRMFGRDCLKVGGKVFAVAHPEELVVKLGQERADELVGAGEATPFNPGKAGRRPMTGWAVIPAPADEDLDTWAVLAVEAHAFVATISKG